MTSVGTILLLLMLLVPGIGGIILQIFLSKKAGKWPGLILPLLTLCISLIAVFSIAASTITAYTRFQLQDNMGNVVGESTPEAGSAKTIQKIPDIPSLFFTALQVFLLFNLPTIILLAIYFAYRTRLRRKKALEKMQLQDLE